MIRIINQTHLLKPAIKSILLISGLMVFLSACQSKKGSTVENAAEASITAKTENSTKESPLTENNFFKKLKGTLGAYPITVYLIKKEKDLMGSYYFDSIGKPINLTGNIDETGHFTLDEKIFSTGKFTGSFIGNNQIEGNWANTKKGETLKLQLMETPDNSAPVFFNQAYKENCSIAIENRKNYKPEMSYWDTVCSSIKTSYITIKLKDSAIASSINKTIEKAVCGYGVEKEKNQSIRALMNSVEEVGKDDGYILDIHTTLQSNEPNILSVLIGCNVFYFGAAHGNYSGRGYNFDISSGKEIKLDDIFIPDYKKMLDKIAAPFFYKENGKSNWWFKNGKFELNDNFTIVPGGLQFHFDPYEIGPYSSGAPEVFIPSVALKDLIKKESVLGGWKN